MSTLKEIGALDLIPKNTEHSVTLEVERIPTQEGSQTETKTARRDSAPPETPFEPQATINPTMSQTLLAPEVSDRSPLLPAGQHPYNSTAKVSSMVEDGVNTVSNSGLTEPEILNLDNPNKDILGG